MLVVVHSFPVGSVIMAPEFDLGFMAATLDAEAFLEYLAWYDEYTASQWRHDSLCECLRDQLGKRLSIFPCNAPSLQCGGQTGPLLHRLRRR